MKLLLFFEGGEAMAESNSKRPDPNEARFTTADNSTWYPGARRLFAEGLGTFFLVAIAAGADVAARITGGEVSAAVRAVAPGLYVMAFIYAIGDVSGLHINPVVTMGFALKRVFPARWVPGYWIAQLLGASAAGLVLVLVFGSDASAGVSTPHVPALTAVAIEIFLTAVLLSVILGTADRAHLMGPNAALAVGATIILCGLIALPLEGASMNPARSTGPALANLELGDLWIYWIGPFIGGLMAVAVMSYLHGQGPVSPKEVDAAVGDRG